MRTCGFAQGCCACGHDPAVANDEALLAGKAGAGTGAEALEGTAIAGTRAEDGGEAEAGHRY